VLESASQGELHLDLQEEIDELALQIERTIAENQRVLEEFDLVEAPEKVIVDNRIADADPEELFS
jgi:hypothetical protein